MVKDSAAQCNVGFFPPVVVASGYFGLCELLMEMTLHIDGTKAPKSDFYSATRC
jgi:hypothetical protein